MSKIVKLNTICEVKIGDVWCIGEVIDITRDGKTYWVETWEDTYNVSYKEVRNIEE